MASNKQPNEFVPDTPMVVWVIAAPVLMIVIGLPLALIIPPVLILIPIAIPVLIYVAIKGEKVNRDAKRRACARVSGSSELYVVEDGYQTTVVLNDWGIIKTASRKPAIEVSWHDIAGVEEPEPMILRVDCAGNRRFDIDLNHGRYFLVTRAIFDKIGPRTEFDIDPVTGASNVMRKLEQRKRRWGDFSIGMDGVEYQGRRMSWSAITGIEESHIVREDLPDTYYLRFTSGREQFEIDAATVSATVVKTIAYTLVPHRCNFERPPLTPRELAFQEFETCSARIKAGFSSARKTGKFKVLEVYFAHMLHLVELYSLKGGAPCHIDGWDVDTFLANYAEMLRLTGRAREAEDLESRVRG